MSGPALHETPSADLKYLQILLKQHHIDLHQVKNLVFDAVYNDYIKLLRPGERITGGLQQRLRIIEGQLQCQCTCNRRLLARLIILIAPDLRENLP